MLLAMVVLLMLARAPGAAAAPDEATSSMFHGGAAHTGQQPGPPPEGVPVQRWVFETGGAVRSSPVVLDGVVYAGSRDTSLYAIDAETGDEIWSFATGGAIVTSPAVADGRVFTSSFDGFLYAVDAISGEELWRFRTTAASSPTVADGVVYVGTNDGALYALNAQTGGMRWSAAFGSDEVGVPTVAGQTVFVGAGNHMRAYDKTSGQLRWTYDARGPVAVTPAVAGGLVVFLAAAVTESQRAETSGPLPTAVGQDEASAPDASEAAPSTDPTRQEITRGAVVALESTTAALRWTFNFGADRLSRSTPAIVDGTVYVGAEGGIVRAIDSSTGLESWGYRVGSAIVSSPALAGGLLFIGCYDGMLYALDAATGAARWTFETGGSVHSSPAVVDGIVYVGSDDGSLYAVAGS